MAAKQGSQGTDVASLLSALSSREDASRKMAVFKLQSLMNDPAFAEQFVAKGGLKKLHDIVLVTSGNTQAYGLASFARLLEVDQGWEGVDEEIVEKVKHVSILPALRKADNVI